MKTKKIIKALKLVKKYCNGVTCGKCSLKDFTNHQYDGCPIWAMPCNWKLDHLDNQLEQIKDQHLIKKFREE